jgi:hypothetical protein
MIDDIVSAIDRAAKEGARVVNLSLGMSFKAEDASFNKYMGLAKKIKAAMDRHPQVLFVSAAGNDSQWLDNETNFSLPCGLDIKNQLCVGAVRDENHLASFTNRELMCSQPFLRKCAMKKFPAAI